MKNNLAVLIGMFLLMVTMVVADSEHDFTEAESLIASNIDCESLTLDQLELIGDYYMEQIHPGEMHEIMDVHMGGEGSEELRAFHISLAKQAYCNEQNYESYGMMGSNYMQGGNMMGYNSPAQKNLGVMGHSRYFFAYGPLYWLLTILVGIGIITALAILYKTIFIKKTYKK